MCLWGSWTAVEAPQPRMSKTDCEPDRQTDREEVMHSSEPDPPCALASPLTLYLFTTVAGDWGISRRLRLIGSDCEKRGALRLKLETYVALPHCVCVCVCVCVKTAAMVVQLSLERGLSLGERRRRRSGV